MAAELVVEVSRPIDMPFKGTGDSAISFQSNREISVAAELVVEVRDLGGASKQVRKLEADLSEAVAKTRFLGAAEVPLAATLSATSGAFSMH